LDRITLNELLDLPYLAKVVHEHREKVDKYVEAFEGLAVSPISSSPVQDSPKGAKGGVKTEEGEGSGGSFEEPVSPSSGKPRSSAHFSS